MTMLFILAILFGALLADSSVAQSVDEWRVICNDNKAQGVLRKRLGGLDLRLFEWELKFSCPRLALSASPIHDSADSSREASHTDWVYDARYSADGRTILTAGKDESVGVWDAATGKLTRRIAMPQGPAPGERSSISYVRSATFVGDGTIVAAAKDGYPVLLFDLATGARIAELPKIPSVYRPRMAATKSGLLLLGGDQDEVVAIDIPAKTLRYRLAGHKTGPGAIGVSESADLVATGAVVADSERGKPNAEHRVNLWRLSTGEKLSELVFRSGSDADALAFSRDGTQLAVLAGGTVHINSIKDKSTIRRIEVHPFAGFDVAFTADGKGLITCQSHPILWDLATGEIARHFGPFKDLCHSIDVSPDGKFVVSTSMASDVKIWEIATGAFYRRLGIDVKPPR